MFANRRTNTSRPRRLWLEGMEERAVPAVIDGVTPPTDPDTVVITNVEEEPGGAIDGDPNIYYSSAGGESSTPPSVDLGVTTTVDRSSPGISDIITVTMTVTNNGTTLSTGATANLTLPTGLAFVKANVPSGTSFDANTGTFSPGILGPGESQVLRVQARVLDLAATAVTAAIGTADQADTNTANNSATVNVTPVQGKLVLGHTASTAKPTLGTWIVFTITVRNTGPGHATNVSVAETFSAGLANVRAVSTSHGSYNATTKTWSVGNVRNGNTATLRLTAQVTRLGEQTVDGVLSGTGFDAAASTVAAQAKTLVVRDNTPANWTYFSGPNYQMSGTGPSYAKPVIPPKPTKPIVPPAVVPVVANNAQAQAAAKALIALGFVFKGM